jgi:hypothetical protein
MSYWTVKTAAGTWWIRPLDGRWRVGLNNEDLGSYHKPELALDELVRGHTFRPRNVDPRQEGIPHSFSEWTLVRLPC